MRLLPNGARWPTPCQLLSLLEGDKNSGAFGCLLAAVNARLLGISAKKGGPGEELRTGTDV
jgi:hypothetical protein